MRTAIFTGMLFLSGASALLFQTLWLRLSGLTFGNSAWSAALILSSFMAGLALGSAIAAKTRLRTLRPLHIYSLLELIIALSGCALVFVLPTSGSLLRPVFRLLWEHQAALNVLRFTLCFLILLIPTTAMGLSLPVLLNDPALRRSEFARSLGLLYGANTLGAVAGAIAGEAFLVAAFGLLGTSIFAGILNAVAATIALLLSRLPGVDAAINKRTTARVAGVKLPVRLCLVSFGCGASLLSLEVVWLRFLRLYVASSSTAFAIMLAIVLAGIALGSLLIGFLSSRFRSAQAWLPHLLAMAAVVALSCYLFFPVPSLRSGEDFYYVESWREITTLALALMFPVALLSGAIFPLVTASVQERLGDRMNSTGVTTVFNTLGATLGPLATSFVCLPLLGFQSTLVLCAGLYLVLAILSLGTIRIRWRRSTTLAFVFVVVFFATLLAFFPYQRSREHLANARRSYETQGLKLLKVIEGNSDTYQLMRRQLLGETYYYRLLTNAYSMSATNPLNQRYMRLSAYLPRIFQPRAHNALLLCYGLGATADALLRGDQLRRVDIVDISKEVFQLSPLHSDENNPDPLRNPKTSAFVQDGRFYLQVARAEYDIITGEPPPPKVAGTVNLYTEEFFSLLAGALKPEGIASFWLPIYQLKVSETKSILRAFHNAFPNASVWASSDYEWIMMGINSPGRRLDDRDFRKLWDTAATSADLRRIGVETPEQSSALFVMDGDEIDRITRDSPPLTDLYPKRLSDDLPDLAATHDFAWPYIEASQALPRFRSSKLIQQIWPGFDSRTLAPYFVARETRYLSSINPSNRFAELDLYLRRSTLRAPVLEILGSDAFRLDIAQRHSANHPETAAEALPDLVAGALAQRDTPRAIALLEQALQRGVASGDDLLLLTYVYCVDGNVALAEVFAGLHSKEVSKAEADSL